MGTKQTVTGAKSCLSLPWQPRSNLAANLSQGIKSTWPRVKYGSTRTNKVLYHYFRVSVYV